jgi:transposase
MKKIVGKTQAIAQADLRKKRLKQRLRCVKLVQNGKSMSEVGRKYKVLPRLVSYWVKWFEEGGIEGLKDNRAQSGAKSKLNPLQLKKVRAFIVNAGPSLSGNFLSQHVKKIFGISLTRQQCRRIINKARNS